MNCKQDDLARIVSIHPALAEVTDRFVTCLELTIFNGEPAWKLDRRVEFVALQNFRSNGTDFYTGESVYFDQLQDKYLRPIRDADGQDESLTWKTAPLSPIALTPKPQKEFT